MKSLKRIFCISILIIVILVLSEANVVRAQEVIGTIPIRGVPLAIAYDSGKGEIFVAEATNPNMGALNPDNPGIVSVISDSSNKVLTTIPVGEGSMAIAYDSGKDEIFVANQGSNTVSVISDTSNVVVANVPVDNAINLVYDSGMGEIFALSAISGSGSGDQVSVISDSSNKVVATVSVYHCFDLAYDAGKGEIFALSASGSVARSSSSAYSIISIISDKSNSVVANLTVGFTSGGIAYDSGKGEVFVTDTLNTTLSVISDSTNAVVSSTGPVIGLPSYLAYDSGKGEILAAGLGILEVISDSNNAVVANVTMIFGEKVVEGPLAYDSGKNEIFVANLNVASFSGSVYVLSDASKGTSASSSPAVPELSWLVIVPLLLSMLAVAVIVRHRKNR
jgi:YVTN family beta-propeller protein